MFFLAPPIAHLLEVCQQHFEGRCSSDEVLQALKPARDFVQEAQLLFVLMRPTILQNEEVSELLNQVRLEVEAQQRALSEIERTAKSKRCRV